MNTLLIPAKEVQNEISIEKSRFIATLAPVFNVEEARSFISRIKDTYPDASHNVPAFIIGHGASKISHASDDGEPSGTAGRPVLAVLTGSNLGDVVVVVTRYFGGKKLGKGGLVRAYGNAVREVLKVTPLAQKASTHTLEFRIPYSLYERTCQLIQDNQGKIVDEVFSADVLITCQVLTHGFNVFKSQLDGLFQGKIKVKITQEDQVTILPI